MQNVALKAVHTTVGDRIRQAREAIKISGKPMSQGELARRLRVSRAAVSQWESGNTLSLKHENLMNLAKEVKSSSNYLLHGIESKEGRKVALDVSDKAHELAHAWDDMPEGEWKERIYYFVTTFLVFQKQQEAEKRIQQAKRSKRSK